MLDHGRDARPILLLLEGSLRSLVFLRLFPAIGHLLLPPLRFACDRLAAALALLPHYVDGEILSVRQALRAYAHRSAPALYDVFWHRYNASSLARRRRTRDLTARKGPRIKERRADEIRKGDILWSDVSGRLFVFDVYEVEVEASGNPLAAGTFDDG